MSHGTGVPPSSPQRTAAIVLAYVAVVPLTLIWVVFLAMIISLDGPSQMAALLPMAAFAFTGWLWALLAIIALLLTKGEQRRAHPITVAVIALAEAVLALGFFFSG